MLFLLAQEISLISESRSGKMRFMSNGLAWSVV
jgi:hypothetical protein